MGNINNYLEWRGDIPFSKISPYNEIDALILARISYLRFNMINVEKKETIKSISKKMKDIKNEDFLFNGDKELITLLGKSKRFNELVITDYEEINDKKIEKQFSAITIHLPNNIIYISFIGTDMSIFGWKEDFNMAFMDEVPAQKNGLEYVRRIAKKYRHKKIRMGGHSKGGNIAIYAAFNLDKNIQNRIISIDNYDGPGFDEKLIKFENIERIVNKITTYIPQESIIGRLFDHKEKRVIVLSNAKGIMQHDIYSWNVCRDKFVISDKPDFTSELLDKTIKKWLNECTIEERKVFVDNLFELFYSTDVEEFPEFAKIWKKKIPNIIKAYKNIDDKSRHLSGQTLSKLLRTSFKVIKEEAREHIKDITNKEKIEKKGFTN